MVADRSGGLGQALSGLTTIKSKVSSGSDLSAPQQVKHSPGDGSTMYQSFPSSNANAGLKSHHMHSHIHKLRTETWEDRVCTY